MSGKRAITPVASWNMARRERRVPQENAKEAVGSSGPECCKRERHAPTSVGEAELPPRSKAEAMTLTTRALSLSFSSIALSVCLGAACDAPPPAVAQGSGVDALRVGGAKGTRLYVDNQLLVETDERHPTSTAAFDLVENARVDLSLTSTADGAEPFGWRLYRVGADGARERIASADGQNGVAAARVDAGAGGAFIVESTGPWLKPFHLNLACVAPAGACTPLRQPKQACGGEIGDGCDDGLYCDVGETCGGARAVGMCHRERFLCPRIYRPVCGCDGQTYANSCSASADAMSVAHEGACDCDASLFTAPRGSTSAEDLIGTWTLSGARDGARVRAKLALDARCDDASCTNTYTLTEEIVSRCDADGQHCMSRAARASAGTWEMQDDVLVLRPRSGTATAPRLELKGNCMGTLQLAASDVAPGAAFERLP
jgi:hypothetical protein